LAINYLQSRVAADIIILAIQPGTLVFGDTLSQSIEKTLTQLEDWFSRLTSGIAAG
jgi:recombinational DNA repair protein RecR